MIIDYFTFNINERLDAVVLDARGKWHVCGIHKPLDGKYELYAVYPNMASLENAIAKQEHVGIFSYEAEARLAALGYAITKAALSGYVDINTIEDLVKSFVKGVNAGMDEVGPGAIEVVVLE